MVIINEVKAAGIDCLKVENGLISLLVTRSMGPRILQLKPHGAGNLFAELPDTTLEIPGGGLYHLWGGHRLWHSPEVKKRTYIRDDLPVTVEETAKGIRLIQPVENQTGVQKTILVTLPEDDQAVVIVDHLLTNQNLWPVTLSPWAISILKPGGVAILPQNVETADPDGLLSNRNLVLWPYSDITLVNIRWGNRAIYLHVPLENGAFKIGFANPRGWVAYYNRPHLFVKKVQYQPDKTYPDNGCSSECYCNPLFLELETLGPLESVEPGKTIKHTETWEIHSLLHFETTDHQVDLIEKLLK